MVVVPALDDGITLGSAGHGLLLLHVARMHSALEMHNHALNRNGHLAHGRPMGRLAQGGGEQLSDAGVPRFIQLQLLTGPAHHANELLRPQVSPGPLPGEEAPDDASERIHVASLRLVIAREHLWGSVVQGLGGQSSSRGSLVIDNQAVGESIHLAPLAGHENSTGGELSVAEAHLMDGGHTIRHVQGHAQRDKRLNCTACRDVLEGAVHALPDHAQAPGGFYGVPVYHHNVLGTHGPTVQDLPAKALQSSDPAPFLRDHLDTHMLTLPYAGPHLAAPELRQLLAETHSPLLNAQSSWQAGDQLLALRDILFLHPHSGKLLSKRVRGCLLGPSRDPQHRQQQETHAEDESTEPENAFLTLQQELPQAAEHGGHRGQHRRCLGRSSKTLAPGLLDHIFLPCFLLQGPVFGVGLRCRLTRRLARHHLQGRLNRRRCL
mmetsp:Transcript_6002/g.14330  ORF Transcript_6002/g.14330 Transcript_6002/m.14330 type:complete len:435 (+) Transcript_6002:156-1460(+)